jgi:histidine triad (HIT) family protein
MVTRLSPLTLFDKIVAGDIPCTKVYEDDTALAFRDIAPAAPTHVVIVPKDRAGLTHLHKMSKEHKALVGHLMWVASEVARQEGLVEDGYRIVINDGENAGQTVFHLHIHVIGGRTLTWPPG